jgi:hypothetical protein
MAEGWRCCPRCRRARPERELQAYQRYGSRRYGRVLPSGFRCPGCGYLSEERTQEVPAQTDRLRATLSSPEARTLVISNDRTDP